MTEKIDTILTLGGASVVVKVPKSIPAKRIPLTEAEIEEMNENWDRCHAQMASQEEMKEIYGNKKQQI